MKARALITGGAGFIGSHLTDRLLADGHEVVVIDNLSSGRIENLGHLKGNKNLLFQLADVSNFSEIKPFFEGVDWVFHLAALADIVPSVQEPLKYHRANVDGTVNVLEAARLNGARRFVYAASSSCYGIPDKFPTSETAAIRPMYPYALTKYIGEQYLLHWVKLYKLPGVALRLFNVYGPRSRTSGAYGAVFGVFLAQKLAGKPFTIVGDGSQARDFIFVTDVADAFVQAASSGIEGEIFNVGAGSPQSVNRLVELMGGEAVYVPKRPGEPDRTHADISKIKKMLKWQASVSFEGGVKIMLSKIDYWKQAPVWTPEKIEEATKDWFRYLSR